MKIAGITLIQPSVGSLMASAIAIALFASVLSGAHFIGLLDAQYVWPITAAMSLGTLAATFGISPQRGGVRAIAVLAGLGTILAVLT